MKHIIYFLKYKGYWIPAIIAGVAYYCIFSRLSVMWQQLSFLFAIFAVFVYFCVMIYIVPIIHFFRGWGRSGDIYKAGIKLYNCPICGSNNIRVRQDGWWYRACCFNCDVIDKPYANPNLARMMWNKHVKRIVEKAQRKAAKPVPMPAPTTKAAPAPAPGATNTAGYCRHCGAGFAAGDIFCGACGQKL